MPWSWVRLVLLLLVAVASELVYLQFWPLSFYLGEGPDYTREYLAQYRLVREWLTHLLVWFEAASPDAPGSLELLIDALMRAFVAAFCLYLVAFWLTRSGLPDGWGGIAVVMPALAFQATLFLMPGLLSRDLFSYVLYGDIAGLYGLNPYTQVPAAFPHNRMYYWIPLFWHQTPSVYGPAWTELSSAISAGTAAWSDVDRVLAYKLLVNLTHLIGIGSLALAVERLRPGVVLPSLLLYAWNPLVLFEFGGHGHNDAVMVTLMLFGLALFAQGRPWIGLVALAVSFSIKLSSVLLLPYYAMGWARRCRTLSETALVLALSAMTVLLIVVGLYRLWWTGPETLEPLLTRSQGTMYFNYVPDIVLRRLLAEHLVQPGGPDPAVALEEARAWVRLVTRVLFAGYCGWELLRVRDGLSMAGAGARVMLAFLLLFSTWVHPWYFTWPLALASILGWESITARVLLGFSLSAPTVIYYNHLWNPYTSDSSYLLYVAPIAIAPLAWLVRRAPSSRVTRINPVRFQAGPQPGRDAPQ